MTAHRALAVVIGTVVLFGCAMTSPLIKDPGSLSPAEFTIAAVTYVCFAAIAIARWPAWILVAAPAAGGFISLAAGARLDLIGSVLLVAVLVFSLGRDLTPVIIATVAAAGVLGVGHLLFELHAKTGLSDLDVVPALAVVATAGQAIRVRRAQKAMLEERARRVEENREHEARLRVHSERLRIARDLHDAVGHQVALISVQAGAMGYLLDTDPDKARESLAHIQQAGEVDEYVFEALRSGASGFLGKGSRPDVLIEAIRTVARGDALLSPAATRGLIARFLTLHDRAPEATPALVDALTEREREIVALVATGMSNAEIADQLTLSPLTVKTHANHAMTKLGARDRAQLVVLAYRAGLAGARSNQERN